ncbi:hypothetical protein ACIRRH_06090 [Kitasatospora sp. NPDC101235]|uniref:hypothetical protein n=1 Tax=Kitasatospora sp. NPDC101235 TaxID=3364101 RepID=UPI00381B7395
MHTERTSGLDRLLTWLTAGLVTVVLLGPAVYLGLIVFVWTSSDDGPARTGCSKVLAFAGGSLPAEAAGASCTDDGSWQEEGYGAEFRMPRADLAARLTEAFPRVRQDAASASGLSFSSDGAAGTHPSGQAAVVRLNVTYDDTETARVSLRAFNL